ncbi:peptidoglycan recognition protein [Streptomyces solicathayae]|uniref:Peptidoglycan recognition protein n=1 Tax=Streptomyces solicathayae TaxID=3081768 RepID=A0ABZ0LX90_9ACTN|nr:peptidoglycan recognition protein [Streptomyces sp. HUAS YS2]WOX24032.1 peptidoglycan recognition protein [Streptomyces sp. HUAS YS2]
MRAYLATSIGVVCTAALVLPLAPAAGAAAPPPSDPLSRASAPAASSRAPDSPAGGTQSLALGNLGGPRVAGSAAVQGLTRRDVRPFSLVGVVWDDAETELHGTVQVRTRATGGTAWSEWQDVETHNLEHAADPGTAERASGPVRGATAPLWVGDSDGVEVRVRAERAAALPEGLHLELVDPGEDPAAEAWAEVPADPAADRAVEAASAAAAAVSDDAADGVRSVSLAAAEGTVIPALSQDETRALYAENLALRAKPYIGPRPRIITRKGWGADERLREKKFVYTKKVKAAFVHHSATGNNYTCKQAPSVLRSIYRYHVVSSGWRDFGYNFAVDKCGNIYEGRAGGVSKPVLGAHTRGFNTNSMGIAVLGTFGSSTPPAAAVTAVARLTAWKLGLFGANPRGTTTLTSGGGNLYKKGRKVRLNVISGHRDGFATSCPGARLYKKLGATRTASAKYQGRS